jgi:hypothetical protein
LQIKWDYKTKTLVYGAVLNIRLHLVNEKLAIKVPLKTEENIEAAVKFFIDTIQWAG